MLEYTTYSPHLAGKNLKQIFEYGDAGMNSLKEMVEDPKNGIN